ncbi:anthranilate synthase component II [Clostridium folliculivorans]|uniref:Aminodeoxychorismate/anthranilate synthase component II n=1 Tax=Clostridium folliculivorans TaxID=2886038 RepID=A0A9W5Y2R5_9CLOT|nr:aminodeoxychorismate/anthranilate synthase component II [Clostridium folliculivorans]GKU25519.1 aminodeoxychorismate/anthranilate synthase component II [Clostridium folliculivorans]GKU28542.1 aminodeoxychorismate/anthranilate synthase component II [Clostridium folliculivorans]
MIVLIDNYDSFTYNVYQYLSELGEEVEVYRNDKITSNDIKQLSPEAIIISPGPGYPKDAGNSLDIISGNYKNIPILGICLGHQSIGEVFGGTIIKAQKVMHGKSSEIYHEDNVLFKDIQCPTKVMRYHSLVIDKASLSEELKVIATSIDDKEIMAVKHVKYPVYGIQFHPESIFTPMGKKLLENFIEIKNSYRRNVV